MVNASWYAVLSSIREDWPYSVSPGGLSYGGGNATYYPKQEEQGYAGYSAPFCTLACAVLTLPLRHQIFRAHLLGTCLS